MAAESTAVIRRSLPGTPAAALYTVNKFLPAPLFTELTGQFSMQEYLQSLITANPHNIQQLITLPATADRDVFLYEHFRLLLRDLNELTVLLGQECNQSTCPTMIATTDWEFLCAAHSKPQKCSAIDYIIHTLAGFTSLLSSAELFPSRISINSTSSKHFSAIARRMYRLFAHTVYHHKSIYTVIESRLALCERFIALSLKYSLIEPSQLTPHILFDNNSPAYTTPPVAAAAQ